MFGRVLQRLLGDPVNHLLNRERQPRGLPPNPQTHLRAAGGADSSLGLKEAKELVEAAPKAVLEKATKEAAEKAKEALEGAGATVTLK